MVYSRGYILPLDGEKEGLPQAARRDLLGSDLMFAGSRSHLGVFGLVNSCAQEFTLPAVMVLRPCQKPRLLIY